MTTALVIGANGGIAQALVKQLCEGNEYSKVVTVSRTAFSAPYQKQVHIELDAGQDAQVEGFVANMKAASEKFSLVVCCTGTLHGAVGADGSDKLKPEKRLEDIQSEHLAEYFRVNSILPALWLKRLPKILEKTAKLVFFSARVGSISENQLGGWYGYRASKAALNMLVKTAAIEYRRRMPQVCLMCYHPGTVDTGLSKPFQANVKPGKLFTPEFTVQSLLTEVNKLEPEQSPYYLDWKGDTITW